MRVRVRPTELGWKGLLLLGALIGAFLATAYSNTFFLMLVFCCALGVLACAWTVANVRGLRCVRVDVPVAAAGAAREVVVQLHARRERRDLDVALCVGRATLAAGTAAAVAGTTGVRGTLPARARGVERVDAVRVSSRFPLGLFVAHVDLPCTAEVVTPPAPALAPVRPRDEAAAGDRVGRRGVRSPSVAELRPFRSGDALGDVHWKATARRGTAVVKEREQLADRALAIALDRRCEQAALEQALAVVAAHERLARERGLTLRVDSQGARFVVGRDRAQAAALLRWLAAAGVAAADGGDVVHAPGALRLPGRAAARSAEAAR